MSFFLHFPSRWQNFSAMKKTLPNSKVFYK